MRLPLWVFLTNYICRIFLDTSKKKKKKKKRLVTNNQAHKSLKIFFHYLILASISEIISDTDTNPPPDKYQ